MKDIDARGLNDRLAKGEGMLLLDVREPAELRSYPGAITGVVNIPLGQLTARIAEIAAYKDKPVISICRSGARAVTAARFLEASGFRDVLVLRGGMLMYNR